MNTANIVNAASNCHPIHPKPQTAAAKAADSERGHRRQCPSSYKATGAGLLRGIDCLPHRYGPISQLLIWQHP